MLALIKGRLSFLRFLVGLPIFVLVLTSCTPNNSRPESTVSVPQAKTPEIGIQCEPIAQRIIGETIRATGQVRPDLGKESDVAARFSGRIISVLVAPGDYVTPGQILAMVDSHEIATLQGELIEAQSKLMTAKAQQEREQQAYEENLSRPQALIRARTQYDHSKVELDLAKAEYQRLEGLRKEKIAAEKDFLAAKAKLAQSELAHTEAAQQLQREEALYKNQSLLRKDLQLSEAETARAQQHVNTLVQRLQFVGIGEDLIRQVTSTSKIIDQLPMRARVSGVITQHDAAVGELIEPSKKIFTITDLSTVAVCADIPEVDLKWIKLGNKAHIKIASYPDRVFNGVISYVSDTVDPATRTVSVRIKLDNPNHLLKVNMFADIELQGSPRPVIACPKDAVQESDGAKIVFLKVADGYKPRKVELSGDTENYYEVVSGLNIGEQVVTRGSLLLKTELNLNQQ